GVPFERLDHAIAAKQPLFSVSLPYAMTESCRGLYRVFLEAPGPPAYAGSRDGPCGFASGVANARDVAIEQCGGVTTQPCELYADGEAVVWRSGETTVVTADSAQR